MIKFFRHLFLDDFMLKLFSFVLAVLFWLTVSFAIQQNEPSSSPLSLSPESRLVLRLAVQPSASTVDVRKLKFVPPEVDITLQGEAHFIQELPTHDIRASVDLSNVDLTRNSTNHVQVTIPAGINYVRVVPTEVQVIVSPKN